MFKRFSWYLPLPANEGGRKQCFQPCSFKSLFSHAVGRGKVVPHAWAQNRIECRGVEVTELNAVVCSQFNIFFIFLCRHEY